MMLGQRGTKEVPADYIWALWENIPLAERRCHYNLWSLKIHVHQIKVLKGTVQPKIEISSLCFSPLVVEGSLDFLTHVTATVVTCVTTGVYVANVLSCKSLKRCHSSILNHITHWSVQYSYDTLLYVNYLVVWSHYSNSDQGGNGGYFTWKCFFIWLSFTVYLFFYHYLGVLGPQGLTLGGIISLRET